MDYAEIPLISTGVAIIDADLFELISQYRWYLHQKAPTRFYASTKIEGKTIYIHHLVVGKPEKGFVVDHIDGDGLNNRRINLRTVTVRMNCLNSDRNRNAHYIEKHGRKFRVRAGLNYSKVELGSFDTYEEAQIAAKAWHDAK